MEAIVLRFKSRSFRIKLESRVQGGSAADLGSFVDFGPGPPINAATGSQNELTNLLSSGDLYQKPRGSPVYFQRGLPIVITGWIANDRRQIDRNAHSARGANQIRYATTIAYNQFQSRVPQKVTQRVNPVH